MGQQISDHHDSDAKVMLNLQPIFGAMLWWSKICQCVHHYCAPPAGSQVPHLLMLSSCVWQPQDHAPVNGTLVSIVSLSILWGRGNCLKAFTNVLENWLKPITASTVSTGRLCWSYWSWVQVRRWLERMQTAVQAGYLEKAGRSQCQMTEDPRAFIWFMHSSVLLHAATLVCQLLASEDSLLTCILLYSIQCYCLLALTLDLVTFLILCSKQSYQICSDLHSF
jgi:hypothetical protein